MGIAIQWPLVLFTVFAGIGGGILASSGVAQLVGKQSGKAQFASAVTSSILLVVGGCFSLLHLASPENVMAAVFNIFSFSGISMELILLGITFVVAVVFAILLKREASPAACKVVAALGIIAAVLLLFFCGHGYVMVSRPAWDTNMLPLAYLGTSLASGVFAYGVIMALCKAEDAQYKVVKAEMLACCIICAATCASYGATVAGAAMDESAVAFWIGVVACGIVLMLIVGMVAYLRLRSSNAFALAVVGLVVALVAVFAVRIVMWGTSEGYLELFALASTASQVIPSA